MVVLAGDGRLPMLLGELLAAVQHRLPIKIGRSKTLGALLPGGGDEVGGHRQLRHRGPESVLRRGGAISEDVRRECERRLEDSRVPRGVRSRTTARCSCSSRWNLRERSAVEIDEKHATGLAACALRTVLADNRRQLIDLARRNAPQLLWGLHMLGLMKLVVTRGPERGLWDSVGSLWKGQLVVHVVAMPVFPGQ